MMICPGCGEEIPERFRLCGFCGAQLPKVAPPEARKVVTLVFADVTGSTALGERLDPESVRWVMTALLRDRAGGARAPRRHGREVHRRCRDGGLRDPARARGRRGARRARRSRAARSACASSDEEVERATASRIGVRIGVNTGEVVAGDAAAGQAFATGDAVNVAARLEQAAAAGEVLLGEATLRLVARRRRRSRRSSRSRSRARPSPYRPGASSPCATGEPGVSRRFDAPLVGREAELARCSTACSERSTSRTRAAHHRRRARRDRQDAPDRGARWSGSTPKRRC